MHCFTVISNCILYYRFISLSVFQLNGICVCNPGFLGTSCEDKKNNEDSKEMQLQILTDYKLVSSPTEGPVFNKLEAHSEFISSSEAFGPSPRAGHTLTTCGEGLMFLFGGYSHQHGILNDMWMFNVSCKTWTHLLPATDQSPKGRSVVFFSEQQ